MSGIHVQVENRKLGFRIRMLYRHKHHHEIYKLKPEMQFGHTTHFRSDLSYRQ
jgi:hypothetical protein